MKKLILIIVLSLLVGTIMAQRVKVLAPQADWGSISNIVDTTSGEIIFCTNCSEDGTGVLVVFNAGEWQILSSSEFDIPSAPNLDSVYIGLTSITWDWDTVADANGYRWNITNTYATATDMDTTTYRTETSLTCSTTYTRYVWAYNDYGHSEVLTMSGTTDSCFVCDSLIVYHSAGTVAPISDTITYHFTNGILGEPTKCWMVQNLGASTQADSVSDTTHTSLGWYWQFNSKQGYQYIDSTRTPSSDWNVMIAGSSTWTTANDPCAIELGTGWRIPTSTEWYNITNSNGWTNYDSLYNSELKLHLAGRLSNTDGESLYKGSTGYYWSSTEGNTSYGRLFRITSTQAIITNYYKTAGCSIRCIHNP